MTKTDSAIIDEVMRVLIERKQADPDTSYVASLYSAGTNKILEKLGEEAVETILAAKDFDGGGSREALVSETVDLWFHSLVMLSHLDVSTDELYAELNRRFGTSGHTEKAARKS